MKRLATLLAALGVIALPAHRAFAHGVLGDYIFLEPIVTQDPTPANELDISPSWVKTSTANNYSLASSFEKVLWIDQEYMPRVSAGAGSSWSYVAPYKGKNFNGFRSLTMFAKYAFYYSLEYKFLMSCALQLNAPLRSPNIDAENHTSLGPFPWEKAFGDLPNWAIIKLLRPFGVQSDFGYVPALNGHTNHHMFADAIVEYSLPYLSNNVKDIGLKAPLRNMFLFNEINYDQLITEPSGQTFPTLLATPGVAYVSYHYELAVATQFALNDFYRVRSHTFGEARRRLNRTAYRCLQPIHTDPGRGANRGGYRFGPQCGVRIDPAGRSSRDSHASRQYPAGAPLARVKTAPSPAPTGRARY